MNYALFTLLAAGGRSQRVAVMLHAAELDEDFSFAKCFALKRAGLVIAVSDYTGKKAVRLGVRAGVSVERSINGTGAGRLWQPNGNGDNRMVRCSAASTAEQHAEAPPNS